MPPAQTPTQPTPMATQSDVTDPASPEFYTARVQPVFENNCYKCHAGMFHRGNLRLDTPEHIMAGGRSGPVIVPGKPDDSLLIKLVRRLGTGDDFHPMPPKSTLPDADIATIAAWIKAGAVMPKTPQAPAGE